MRVPLLALTLTALALASQPPLVLYYTVRDLGPAQCMPLAIAQTYHYGGYSSSSNYAPGSPFNNTAYCPLYADISAGTYSGHIDFEQAVYADGCSGAKGSPYRLNNLTDYGRGQSCTLVSGASPNVITPIVEEDLQFGMDGIPKPIYCNPLLRNPSGFTSYSKCGWGSSSSSFSTINKVSTNNATMFEKWYNDDPVFNMRSGGTLTVPYIGNGQWQYSSPPPSPTGNGWHPLDTVPVCSNVSGSLDCSNGGKHFPLQHMLGLDENTANHTFSFTTEIHTLFTYTGLDQLFAFSGDDDLWVYINNKLAIDIGGLHQAYKAQIDLDVPYVANYLGLEVGKIYPLDLYNAERHTTQSNFKITTSLSLSCSVLNSAQSVYTWSPGTLAQDFKLIGGLKAATIANGNSIQLTSTTELDLASYVFLRQQVNVGPGFIVQFSFSASPQGSGFVFGLLPQSISNLNGGSGGALGFRNMNASWAVAFDFCPDRNLNPSSPACSARETRMHYLDQPTSPNNVSSSTQRLYSPLYVPNTLNDGFSHNVTVRYFGQQPPWIEVYIDNAMFLQQRNFSMNNVLGTSEAWVGFTAGTGTTPQEASDIFITGLQISAVGIADQNTRAYNVLGNETLTAVADGHHSLSFSLKNYDLCGNPISFGGHKDKAYGMLVAENPTAQPTTSPTSRPSSSPLIHPSRAPTAPTTFTPSNSPNLAPSMAPSIQPTRSPRRSPTFSPSRSPIFKPTRTPSTSRPSRSPTTTKPSKSPTARPTSAVPTSKSPTSSSPTTSKSPTSSSPSTATPTSGVGRRLDAAEHARRRDLVNSVQAPSNFTIVGDVVDNGDGTYSFVFNTTDSGVYDLFMYYGAGCFVNGTASSGLDPVNSHNSSVCFRFVSYRVAQFLPTTPAPTYGSDTSPTALSSAALSGIGVAAGVISAVGCFLIVVGIRVRNRWRRDKEFIEAGRIAAAERGVQYLGDNELDRLQHQLQKTLEEIQKERARKAGPEDQQDAIRALLRQKGELQETVRQLKIRAQGGDPNAPVEGRLSRVRKSFAANSRFRMSVSSNRMSMFRPSVGGDEGARDSSGASLASDNPLFARERNSIFRNPFGHNSGGNSSAKTAPTQATARPVQGSISEVPLPDI